MAKPRSGEATWSVCTFSYWWPSREAAKPPGVFVPFLIIIIIHLLLPWESMAAPRTTDSEVVKFGTLFGTSTLINFTKSHVSQSNRLAPPMGQS